MSELQDHERMAAEASAPLPEDERIEAVTSGSGHEPSDRRAQRRARAVRLVVLGVGLALVTGIGIAHQYGAVKPVGVDALCPFGGIETLWSLISTGALLQRIAVSSVILLVAIVATALLFRRAFCGYLCPLGALQEIVGKVRRVFTSKPRLEMPAAVDRPARYLKYVVLAVFAVWTWQAATLVIRPFDPWVAWMHLTSAEVLTEFWIGLAILGVSLAGSVVYDRFFCKYLCPMGAFLGAISWFSVFKVRRTEATCIDCKACDRACPTNVVVSNAATVESPECINCNECVNACPVADTLTVSTPDLAGRPRYLRPVEMLAMVGALIAVVVVTTSLAGTFKWTLTPPAVASPAGGPTITPEEIKGSMTFAQVSAATGVSPEAIQQRFGVIPSEMGTPIKDLAQTKGFDVHTEVREWFGQQMKSGASAGPSGSTAPAGAATGEGGEAG